MKSHVNLSAFPIVPAAAADRVEIARLLQEAEMPHEDLAGRPVQFLIARDERGRLAGAVGAEIHGADALLRSLVVAPEHRGAGLGGRLVDALDAMAAQAGVATWWLLTMTAEPFFAARGFTRVPRESAPRAIRETSLFATHCPGRAVCMTRAVAARVASAVEFDSAVTELRAKLRAFLRRRVRDDATADDLTQETLLKVYRSRDTLRDDQRLESWVYRIARTTLIDYYRRMRPSEELPDALAAESEDETAAFRKAVSASTARFLEDLPEAYREPVRLAELEGMPLAKIALRMGLSLTAVKSRVRRGRAMLKKKLQDCCRFEFDRAGRVIGWERRQRCACGR